MKALWLACLCALPIGLQDQPKRPREAPPYDREKLAAQVDRIARAAIEKEGVPGLSIAVAEADEVFYAKAFGYADLEHAFPAKETSRFPIGTLTRQFTAVAVLQLVDAGQLKLDDEVAKHLPELPLGGRKVTIQHLLTNTSGLPGWSEIGRDARPGVTFDEKAFFALFKDARFAFEPGEDFALDSANYVVLSLVVSRATKMPYTQYVREKILQPLGLAETDFCPRAHALPGFARDCHSEWEASDFELPGEEARAMFTQSLCTTTRDLVKWQQALVSGALLSETSARTLMAPTKLADGNSTNFGCAVQMAWFHDYKNYAFTGEGAGYRARLSYWSLPKVTIVVLANCESAPVERIERDIARFVLSIPLPPTAEVDLAAEDAARCTGLYQIATTQYRVEERSGQLWFVPPVEPATRLCHRGNLVFAFESDRDVRLTFHVAEGRAEGFTLWRNGFESRARRMD